tara:strand:+ start:306 stop:1013 length:708 start_codon:yes stop_codon:yes gene_type:complete
MSFLGIVIVGTAFLALYWIFYGQGKYNDAFRPKRKTELKAVLFDLDGVIIDSFDAWHSVFNHVRKDFKLKEISKDDFRKNNWGTSAEQDAKKYYKNKTTKEIEDIYKKLMLKNVHKTKIMPDAKKVLKAIKKKKIKIGLVTNSFNNIVNKALKFHKIESYFDEVITSDDVEKPKPYPDSIIKLCNRLKIMPDESIYVGDTKTDYNAGKAAGCFVIGLNTHGDLVIDRLSDLLELV